VRCLYPVTALTVLSLSLAQAQTPRSGDAPCGDDSKIIFARIAMSRFCVLARDSAVRRATGARDALTLMRSVQADVIWRIPDTDLTAFFAAFGESLGFVDARTCAGMFPHSGGPPWTDTFMSVATAVDSAMAVRWTSFIEAWVWARVKNTPRQHEASAAEVYAYARRQLQSISPADRADMVRVGRGDSLPPDRACHAVRLSFARLAAGAPKDAGPVIRALMSGLVPWFAAA
jgi:hypothetical protein